MAFFLRPGYFEDHAAEWDDDLEEWRDNDDEYDEWDGYDDPDDLDEVWNPPTQTEMTWYYRHYGSTKAANSFGYYFKTCRIYQIPHRCRIYDVYLCLDCGKPSHVGDHHNCIPF